MNKKVPISTSIVLTALAMMGEAANAGYAIDVRSEYVNEELKARVLVSLANKEPLDLLSSNFGPLVQILKQDGEPLDIDPNMIIAATDDSTNSTGVGACYTNCYSNCYTNCVYGSRGWR